VTSPFCAELKGAVFISSTTVTVDEVHIMPYIEGVIRGLKGKRIRIIIEETAQGG
jgi:hypothetical protein